MMGTDEAGAVSVRELYCVAGWLLEEADPKPNTLLPRTNCCWCCSWPGD